MKKQIKLAGALLAIMMSATSILNAQWSPTSPNTYFTYTGNVGIGTTAPVYKVQVNNSTSTRSASFENSYSTSSTKYGIHNTVTGTGNGSNYGVFNQVTGATNSTASNYGLRNILSTTGSGTAWGIYSEASNTGGADVYGIYATGTGASSGKSVYGVRGYANGDGINIYNYGVYGVASGSGALTRNIGVYGSANGTGSNWAGYFDGKAYAESMCIGTSSTTYKLNVCGTIRATEVRVETGWCDYVFADDYKLPSLSEVENYIKINKHLPGVTAGPVIEKDGLEVGKVSSQMIKKIEELMLYIIKLQKQVDELKSNK